MSEHEVRPAYFAIIPSDVRYHTALSPNAKLLYGEITALADRNGYCWASNEYLANQFRWGERTVSRLISQMKELGLLRIEMVPTGKGLERRIYIGIMGGCRQNWRYPLSPKFARGCSQNSATPIISIIIHRIYPL